MLVEYSAQRDLNLYKFISSHHIMKDYGYSWNKVPKLRCAFC